MRWQPRRRAPLAIEDNDAAYDAVHLGGLRLIIQRLFQNVAVVISKLHQHVPGDAAHAPS